MKFGIIQFPGSNCDHDAFYATKYNLGAESEYIWHKETALPNNLDCIILPGGFSYGDYLRTGSIASISPVVRAVKEFADKGGYVIGICNGFQILTEAGILPGVLLRNTSLKFICKDIYLKVENKTTAFTNKIDKDVLRIPIAHNEGNYFAQKDTIKALEDTGRIVFRYSSAEGVVSADFNPNGAINNIAGIVNEKGNVLGMMPHPERYSDEMLGCNDGLMVFKSLLATILNNK